jgi:hypothetical protein
MTEAVTVPKDNKIISFPKSKIVREIPESASAVEEIKTKGVTKYADAVAEDLSGALLMDLSNYGMNMDTEQAEKDYVFLSSVMRAVIYRGVGLEHPLHKFIDQAVTINKISDEEENEIEVDEDTKT